MKLFQRFSISMNTATSSVSLSSVWKQKKETKTNFFRFYQQTPIFIIHRGFISASSSHHNKQQQEQKEKERNDKEASKQRKQQHGSVEYHHQKSIGDWKRLFYHNYYYHSKGDHSEEHDDRHHQHNHDHHYSYYDESHDEQTYYYNTSNNPFLRHHTEKSSLLEHFLNPKENEGKEDDEKKHGRNYDSNNNEDNDDDNSFNNEQHENQKSMLSLSLLFLVPLTLSFLSHNMKHKQQQKGEKEKIYYKYIEEELTWVAFRDFLVHAKQIDRIVVSYNNKTANVILKVGAQGIPTTKYRPSLLQHTQQTSKNYNNDKNNNYKKEKRTTQLIYKLQLRDYTSTVSSSFNTNDDDDDESNKDSHKIKAFEKALQKLQMDSGYSKKDFIPIQYQQGLGSVGEFMAAVPFLFLYGMIMSQLRRQTPN